MHFTRKFGVFRFLLADVPIQLIESTMSSWKQWGLHWASLNIKKWKTKNKKTRTCVHNIKCRTSQHTYDSATQLLMEEKKGESPVLTTLSWRLHDSEWRVGRKILTENAIFLQPLTRTASGVESLCFLELLFPFCYSTTTHPFSVLSVALDLCLGVKVKSDGGGPSNISLMRTWWHTHQEEEEEEEEEEPGAVRCREEEAMSSKYSQSWMSHNCLRLSLQRFGDGRNECATAQIWQKKKMWHKEKNWKLRQNSPSLMRCQRRKAFLNRFCPCREGVASWVFGGWLLGAPQGCSGGDSWATRGGNGGSSPPLKRREKKEKNR